MIAVFFGLFCSGHAYAHKVKIFATVEGDSISGYVYYTSSARAKNVPVEFVGPDGKSFDRIKTDAKGEFKVKARYRVDTLLTLDTGDGHGAKWLISADEFPLALPEYQQDNVAKNEQENPSVNKVDLPQSPQDTTNIAAIIQQELRPLREQINHLRAQIDMQEEKKSFQDILGGIGYIIGLTGILFYFAAKRRKEHD